MNEHKLFYEYEKMSFYEIKFLRIKTIQFCLGSL